MTHEAPVTNVMEDNLQVPLCQEENQSDVKIDTVSELAVVSTTLVPTSVDCTQSVTILREEESPLLDLSDKMEGHPSRSLRKPKLFVARNMTEATELREEYWAKSKLQHARLATMTQSLELVNPDKRELRGTKIVLQRTLQVLIELHEKLIEVTECDEVKADLSALQAQTCVAKDHYYHLFPKMHTTDPSSVPTDTMSYSSSRQLTPAALQAEKAVKRHLASAKVQQEERLELYELEDIRAERERQRKEEEFRRNEILEEEERQRKEVERQRKEEEFRRNEFLEEEERQRKEVERQRKKEEFRRECSEKEEERKEKRREEEIRNKALLAQESIKLEEQRDPTLLPRGNSSRSDSLPNLPPADRMADFLDDVMSHHSATHSERDDTLKASGGNEAKRDISYENTRKKEAGNWAPMASEVNRSEKRWALPPPGKVYPTYQHALPPLYENPDVKQKGAIQSTRTQEEQRLIYPARMLNYHPNSWMARPNEPGWQQREDDRMGWVHKPVKTTSLHRGSREAETATTTTSTFRMTPIVQSSSLPVSIASVSLPVPLSLEPTQQPPFAQHTTFYPPPQASPILNVYARPFSAETPQVRETKQTDQPITGFETMAKTMAEAMSRTRLPVQTPEVYLGDPLLYPTWRSSFSLLIGRQNISADEKLLYLQTYVGGRAKEAVQSLFLMKGEEAYDKAIEMLEERFGCPIVIARAFRAKFDSWPTVRPRDGEALRTLADFLQQCLIASRVVGQLNILDDAQYQKTLMDKLPEWLTRGWLKKVTHFKKKSGQYPSFKELVAYIKEEADIACEPVFSLNQRQQPTLISRAPQTPPTKRTNSYSTNALNQKCHGDKGREISRETYAIQGVNPACSFCGDPRHDILACHKFQGLSVEQRRYFIFKSSLCFSCALSTFHQSRNCTQREKCRECGGIHLTLLHGTPFFRPPTATGQAYTPPRSGHLAPPRQHFPNGMARPYETRGHTLLPSRYPQDVRQQQSAVQTRDNVPSGGSSNQISSPSGKVKETSTTKKNTSHSTSTFKVDCERPERTTMVIPVFVSTIDDPSREIKTYALLDTMSSLTFIDDSIAGNLRARQTGTALRLNTMTARAKPIKCGKVSGLQIRAAQSGQRHKLPEVYTTSNLSINPDNISTTDTAEEHPHLRHLAEHMMGHQDDCVAGLLIGYDCPELLMPLEVIQGQPYAVRTVLGWSIVGSMASKRTSQNVLFSSHTEVKQSEWDGETVLHVYRSSIVEASPTDVVKLLERDFVEEEVGTKSQEDIRFMDLIGGNIKVNPEGHYEMPLPFRGEFPAMPENRDAARKRTLSLLRQFEKDPQHKLRYQTFMREIIESGHAERVPDAEILSTPHWYIPHHGVYSEKKPDKIRVVFDCSAQHQGVCINDVLLQGPDLFNSLIGVLCRFRKGKIAFSCDVEKMFHQFHVVPEHRDYLRFLWWEDGDTRTKLLDYRMKVHIFGAVSSPGCANFGLQQVGRDHQGVDHDAASFLQNDFYVDDGLHASNDVETAKRILEKSREICEKSKLHLHKIVSNSPELLQHFPESERSASRTQKIGRTEETATMERILGLQWETDDDAFTFSSEIRPKPETRRGILSTVASIYDPLGLISPIVLQGKLILQQACGDNLEWDVDLAEELKGKWRRWMEELTFLQEISIPRSFFPPTFGVLSTVELHHFSDASEIGYGQCTYLRVMDKEQRVHCTLVMAKSRVAPKKTVTVPRLELQGATLAVKIAKYLHGELRFEGLTHHFWTDSEIVLAYLANQTRRFHVFVANRVSQILGFSSVEQWRHVSSRNNPADHASRGRSVTDLNQSSWYTGPKFLWETEVPRDNKPSKVQESELEIRTSRITSSEGDSFVKHFEQFQTKKSLVRGVACLLRCFDRLQGNSAKTVLESREKAEACLVRHAQHEFSKSSAQTKAKFRELDAKQDMSGCWRVGGRLTNARDELLSHPAILPRDSHISRLWVKDTHESLGHAGRTSVIHALREKGYHIMGVRQVTRKVSKDCVTCRRRYAGPEGQKMADLPEDRVTSSAPFTFCGIDCFGPFVVQDGRRQIKRYGLIVTCLSMRAIHLEVLDDLSTDAFLNGLRNVVAVRGQISLLRSDRGTNFVGASRELKEGWKAMDHQLLKDRLVDMRIEWIFNTPTASHMGGVWERQIRTVRSVLSGLVKKSDGRLNTSSLRTLFYEVMAIVNSRPLSVESLDDPLGPIPLTPNHILTMQSTGILPPPGTFDRADLMARKFWRKAQFLADEFWRLWRRDFLATLQSRRKWQRRQSNLVIGDVVIMREEGICRADWRLARVDEVYPGTDGLVRSCKVSVADTTKDYGTRKGVLTRSSYVRPVHKLTFLVRA